MLRYLISLIFHQNARRIVEAQFMQIQMQFKQEFYGAVK